MSALLLTAGWMIRDPEWSSSPIDGHGNLHVFGITTGQRHEIPGKTWLLTFLPDGWRDTAARRLGYRDVLWNYSVNNDEISVWCHWSITNTLPDCGWFEPVLLDRRGQVVAVGAYPKAGSALGHVVEPIRFPVSPANSGTTLQIRRFQVGSPQRDVVAQIKLPPL